MHTYILAKFVFFWIFMLGEFSTISKFVKNLSFSVFPEILLLSFYDVLYNMYDEKLNVINKTYCIFRDVFPLAMLIDGSVYVDNIIAWFQNKVIYKNYQIIIQTTVKLTAIIFSLNFEIHWGCRLWPTNMGKIRCSPRATRRVDCRRQSKSTSPWAFDWPRFSTREYIPEGKANRGRMETLASGILSLILNDIFY